MSLDTWRTVSDDIAMRAEADELACKPDPGSYLDRFAGQALSCGDTPHRLVLLCVVVLCPSVMSC